jgi:hypothetical protein
MRTLRRVTDGSTTLPLLLVLFTVPLVAVEVPLAEANAAPAPRSQYLPAVASNGDGFLVLWIDQRSIPTATFATRISRDGRILDGHGIRIASSEIGAAQVIWNGSAYVIVFHDGSRMLVMRIDEDGRVLESPRVLVADALPGGIANSGGHVVVGYRRLGEQRALFLTNDAQIAKDVKLGDAETATAPSIAWNGSHFGAAWLLVTGDTSPSVSVVGVRFNMNGAIGTPRLLEDAPGSLEPRIASDGTDFLLLVRDDNFLRYRTRRISGDFATIGDANVLPEELYAYATILWTGTNYVVVAERGAKVSAIRLDRNGAPLAPAVLVENVTTIGSAPAPAAATNGGDLLVAWGSTPTTDGTDIHGAMLHAGTLERTAKSLLSTSATRQFDAMAATNGRNVLTIWREPGGLFARRISIGGQPIDSQPLRLSVGAHAATVVAHDDDYVVAWSEEGSIVTRRIAASGPLQATGGGRIGTSSATVFRLASASMNVTTLITWFETITIKAVRLNDDAMPIDSVPLTISTPGSINRLAVSSSGNEFLVVWGLNETTFEGGAIPLGVRAARVTPALTLLDPTGIDVADSDDAEEGDPSVTWDGSVWVVAWHRKDEDGHEIRAGRVTRQGFALDCDFVDYGKTIVRDAMLPSIEWDGSRYHVAWMKPSLGLQPRAMFIASTRELGEPLENTRPLGDAELFAAPVSFAAVTHGVVASAYARIALEPLYGGVTRAFLDVTSATRRRAVR